MSIVTAQEIMPLSRTLALSTLLLSPVVLAEKPDSTPPQPSIWELDSIEVHGQESDPSTMVRDARQMTRQVITDSKSLVRDMPGVSVLSGGRSGSNGYSIRGVDKNRVAITVDGMPQAEFSLHDIYAGYGYMNGSRNDVEMEHMKSATVHKGPDSFLAGAGAIGGSVQFLTKDIDDFVDTNRTAGGVLKTAYRSSSREWLGVGGAGVRLQNGSSFFLQYTRRHGHEQKNFDGGADIPGIMRSMPDPMRLRGQSWLSKFDLCVTRQHCLLLSHEEVDVRRYTTEHSYSGFNENRYARDSAPQQRDQLAYRWMPDSGLIERVGLSVAVQRIDTVAVTRNFDQDDGFFRQIYDRRMEHRNHLWRLEVEGRALDSRLGRHQPAAEVAWKRSKLSSNNVDRIFLKTRAGDTSLYSILDPVRTSNISFKILDRFQFGQRWSGQAGWRYDGYVHKRQWGVAQKSLAETADSGKSRFSAGTFFGRLSFQVLQNSTLTYGIAQGFRPPSAQELYFRFSRGPNFFVPNPDLKPEHALNHDLTFATQGRLGQAALSTFYTRYKNFIEERHSQRIVPNPYFGQYPGMSPTQTEELNQMVNVDSATLWGVELTGRLDLHEAFGAWKGLSTDIKGSFAHGRTSVGDGMPALQPLELVAGLGYDTPRWGVRTALIYHGAKRERDTLQTSYSFRGARQRAATYLSNMVVLTDVTGYALIHKNVTLSGGVYNVFNRRYFAWDDLRPLLMHGTTGRVDGAGINRYTSPGRNVAASLEIRF